MDNLSRAIEFKKNLMSLHDLVGDDIIFDDNDYKKERDFFVKNYFEQKPSFLRNCRTKDDFTIRLKQVASNTGSWQARREFIESDFIDFLNFLEFGGKHKDIIEKNENEKKKAKKTNRNNGVEIENSFGINTGIFSFMHTRKKKK